VGSMSVNVVCVSQLTGNRLGKTVRCGRPPLLLQSCRKLEFRLSALMDSDLAWVNGYIYLVIYLVRPYQEKTPDPA